MSAGLLDAVRRAGVIGIIRVADPEVALRQAEATLDAGLEVVELAITGPGTTDAVGELVRRRPDALVGVGTVVDLRQARRAADAGAKFLVSPAFSPEVVAFAAETGIGSFPGCLTPSEMLGAMQTGATAVKIFPAHLWSPAALAGLLHALPDLPTVPTGGIGEADARAWIEAGATALGVGSALTAAPDPRPMVAALREAVASGRANG